MERRTALCWASNDGICDSRVELRVVDANDNDVPRDGLTIGEIIARGTALWRDIGGSQALSAEALRGGWFHSGDMATVNEDGYLLVVDRKKDIIVSEERIFPLSNWRRPS